MRHLDASCSDCGTRLGPLVCPTCNGQNSRLTAPTSGADLVDWAKALVSAVNATYQPKLWGLGAKAFVNECERWQRLHSSDEETNT